MKNKKIIIILSMMIAIIVIVLGVTQFFKIKKGTDSQSEETEPIQLTNNILDKTPETLVGDGSIENPYLIQSIEDLVLISKGVNEKSIEEGKVYKLETDLDFKSKSSYVDSEKINFAEQGDINKNGEQETLYKELTTGNGFIPIGKNINTPFSGEIQGNGHTISNLYSKNLKSYCGLIGIISSNKEQEIKISNLTIKNAKLEGNGTGVIAGYCYQTKNILIDSCSVIGGSINGKSGTGGIIGESYSSNLKLNNCKNTANINGIIAGGIIGIAPTNLEIQNCYNEGKIEGDFFAGGIVGDASNSEVIIKKCYNKGEITGNVAGGIICGKKITIEDTFNLGKIDGNNMGGIIANTDAEDLYININRCYYLKATSGRGIKGVEDIPGKVEILDEEAIKVKMKEIFN